MNQVAPSKTADPPLPASASRAGSRSIDGANAAARSGSAGSVLSPATILELLSQDRPLPLLLAGSFAASVVYCLWLLDWRFILGTSPVWGNPRGIVEGSWADISTALSGYYYFIADRWRLPLFHVTKLGFPGGISVVNTDSIPILCLLGRGVYELTGERANPFGLWICACLIGTALGNTWLIARLGGRSIAAALAATVCGLCMPALLFRWGHMSLMGQFEIVLALIFYYAVHRNERRLLPFVIWPAPLFVLALWTHVYLFAMVFVVVAAALGQALLDRTLELRRGALVLAVWLAVVGATLAVSGHVTAQTWQFASGFGLYSMNALSPVIPTRGSLFDTGIPVGGATGGQYEGYNYLGIGAILLICVALAWNASRFTSLLRNHLCLFAVLAGLTLFALSNRIFFGPWTIANLPLPHFVLMLCGYFRSSGRFFWPVGYCIVAASIAAVAARREGAALLLLAAALQWLDTAPLRSALAQSTSRPAAAPLSQPMWSRALARHDLVRVLPPFGCLADGEDWEREVAIQVQLLAARADVATNTVYAARYEPDCANASGAGALAATELRIYFGHRLAGGALPERHEPGPRFCRSSEKLTLCSKLLDGSQAEALLATTTLQYPEKQAYTRALSRGAPPDQVRGTK